ncbi:glycosyltransferase [Candidatus Leptofilum sp.]|uniref:glycosyltransferase n=1 Tax=Candidatus Leptofilum sp. TaxID=3241576 RepID=UPI003B5C60FE
MTQFKHFVLTRFNVRTEFSQGQVPSTRWLTHRFQLFEKYTYASLRCQTVKNFCWFVFFDAATPPQFKQQIDAYTRWPNFVPVYVESLEIGSPTAHMLLSNQIQAHCLPETTHIITTRLDNDDAVSKHFLANVQAHFAGQSAEFVNFPNGYILRRNKLYKKRHLSNPFISFIEEIDNFQTVWLAGHHKLAEFGDIVQIDMSPQWLQVVHQRNFRNRVGVGNLRVPAKLLRREFCFEMADEFADEPKWAIRLENKLKGIRMRSRKRLKYLRQILNPE